MIKLAKDIVKGDVFTCEYGREGNFIEGIVEEAKEVTYDWGDKVEKHIEITFYFTSDKEKEYKQNIIPKPEDKFEIVE